MRKSRPSAHFLALASWLLAQLILAGHEFLCTEPCPSSALGLDLSKQGPTSAASHADAGRAVRQPAGRKKHRLTNPMGPTWQERRVRRKGSDPLEHVRPTDSPIPLPLGQRNIKNKVAIVLNHQEEEPRRIGLDFDLNGTPPSSPPGQEVPVEYVPGEHVPVEQAAPLERIAQHEVMPEEQPAHAHPVDSLDMNDPIPPEFKPILSQVQVAVVHPKLLIKYHTPLKDHISSHPARFPVGKASKFVEQINGLAVYFERCTRLSSTSEMMFAPRIAKLSKPKPSAAKDRGIYQHPSKINTLLGNLIKCILFAHGAFLKQIECPVEQEIKKHDSLMRWLTELILSTANHLPIFGAISHSKYTNLKKKGYAPAQKHVIHSLRGRSDDPTSEFYNDFTPLTLIGIWYKREAPEEWAQHFQSSESTFWLRMGQSMDAAKKSRRWKSGKWVEQALGHQKSAGAEVIDFDLLGLQQGINPQGCGRSWVEKHSWVVDRDNYQPSEVENRIIMEHRRVLESVDSRRIYKPMKTITGVRATLNVAVENTTGKEVWVVKVLDSMSRALRIDALETKMTRLLEGLRQYHQTLIRYIEHSGIQTIPDAHNAFLDWLSEMILNPSARPLHFPLFGYVSNSELADGVLPRDETRFNPIQHWVLRYIAVPDKSRATLNVLSLLGYWYKKHQPDYWRAHFYNEENFGRLFEHAKNLEANLGCPNSPLEW
ncbi:hypothetical protein PtB15_2B783 [Puccinia triticina]|nr:hypothetical protein PtB15_2B783 [Puccinia triticina]